MLKASHKTSEWPGRLKTVVPKGQLYQLLLLPKQSGVPAVPVSNGKIKIKENRAAYLIKINTNREKKRMKTEKKLNQSSSSSFSYS